MATVTREVPKLPDGYFFCITKSRYWKFIIELRKKTWYGSKLVWREVTDNVTCVIPYMLSMKSDIQVYGRYPPKTSVTYESHIEENEHENEDY